MIEPSLTPTEKQRPLVERQALILAKWIAYHNQVKAYVEGVETWSTQVTDSWTKARNSSTRQDEAEREAIAARDKQYADLKAGEFRDIVIAAAVAFGAGLLVGHLAH